MLPKPELLVLFHYRSARLNSMVSLYLIIILNWYNGIKQLSHPKQFYCYLDVCILLCVLSEALYLYNIISYLTSEKLHDALNSAECTITKLNKDITALRLEYGDNLKQLASLQKEKAQISAQLESTQDRLQDVQRDMREMCSEYDHKLLDSQQFAENKAGSFIIPFKLLNYFITKLAFN